MNTHRQLRVWQSARKLVNYVYKLTRALARGKVRCRVTDAQSGLVGTQ